MNKEAEYERIKARILELTSKRIKAEGNVEANKDPTKDTGLRNMVVEFQEQIKYNFREMNSLFYTMTPEEIRSLE